MDHLSNLYELDEDENIKQMERKNIQTQIVHLFMLCAH